MISCIMNALAEHVISHAGQLDGCGATTLDHPLQVFRDFRAVKRLFPSVFDLTIGKRTNGANTDVSDAVLSAHPALLDRQNGLQQRRQLDTEYLGNLVRQ
jgi:hypothetical protein